MKISRLIIISRPLGYILGPGLFLVPFVIFGVPLSPAALFQLIALSFPLCMLLFGVNDYFDRKTDALNPRKGGVHGAVLKESEGRAVIIAATVSASALLLSSILTGVWENMVLTSALIAFSVFYSAPPRLKELPPLDSISNASIMYLIVAMGHTFVEPTLFIPAEGFFRNGYPLLLAVVTIHMFSTIMDYGPDKKAGVKTLATAIGKRKTALAALLLLVVSMMLLETRSPYILIFMAASCIIYLAGSMRDGEIAAKRLFMAQFAAFVLCGGGFILSSVL